MSYRTALACSFAALSTAACTTVEVQYKDAGAFNDPNAAETAKSGMSFYALQSVYVDVAPKPAEKPDGGKSGKTNGAGEFEESAPADKTEKPKTEKPKAEKPKTEKPKTEKPKTEKPKTEKPKTGDQAGKDEKPAAEDGKEDSAEAPAAPPTLGSGQPAGPAGSVIIDGQEIQATLRAVPDTDHGFMMGGTNGFFKKTAVTGTKYPDSDRIGAVSIKAENLTVKRIGQLAKVAGYFLSPGGTKDLAEAADKAPPLPSFSFPVNLATNGKAQDVPGTNAWTYTLTFDAQPKGAVSWAYFKTLHAEKKVNYFPVPACLNATLELKTKSAEPLAYVFKSFVVSTPDIVRLEPLPVDGKLTLSPVCSGTVEGNTTTDRYDEAFAIAEALYQAREDLKKKEEEEGEAEGEGEGDGDTNTDTEESEN